MLKDLIKLNLIGLLVILLFTQNSYAFDTSADYAILIDCDTSEVLYQKNADKKMHPSSLTKLLTSYVVFKKIEEHKISPSSYTRVSEKAYKERGSSMFLKHMEKVSVNELLNGLITQSGNDAALVLAETAEKNELNFVDEMNKTAKEIGLNSSHFKNPSGLNEEGHYMSARDIATISQRIITDYPKHYKEYFGNKYYSHNNIKQRNRNLLVGSYEGADGLKTGHTQKGGYGISVSAIRNNRRLIAVLNGMESKKERKEEAIKLLDYGFNNFEKATLFKKGEVIIQAPTWLSSKQNVDLKLKDDLVITYKKNEDFSKNEVKIKAEYYSPIGYNVKKGEKVGSLIVEVNNQKFEKDLVLSENLEKANYWNRVLLASKHKITQIYKVLTN